MILPALRDTLFCSEDNNGDAAGAETVFFTFLLVTFEIIDLCVVVLVVEVGLSVAKDNTCRRWDTDGASVGCSEGRVWLVMFFEK